MPDFERHSVVVTGATGNLGNVVVRAYLEAGAHVAIPVRETAKAEALRASLGPLAGADGDPRLLVVGAELAERTSMDAFVERVMRACGRLDVLANLAGGFGSRPADDVPKMRALWEQNVASVVVPTAACLVPMRARAYGRIVSIPASTAPKCGPNTAAYAR